MKFAFNIESKLWKFFDCAGDLVVLNLLFILTSIPVVTIGASVTAMDAVLFRMKEKRMDDVRAEYLRAFRSNLKNSTVIWMVFCVFVVLCLLNFHLVSNVNPNNRNLIFMVLGTVFPIMAMTVLYSFAMLARFQNSLLETVQKAFVIGILSLPYTIAIFLVLTASILAGIQTYLSILIAASVWLLIGFALAGFVCCEMFYRAFRRFTFADELPKDTLDEEMYARRAFYREQKQKKKLEKRKS